MRRRIPEVLALAALAIALAAFIYQHFASKGAWFDWPQLWHYETAIACCITAAVALMVGKYLGRL